MKRSITATGLALAATLAATAVPAADFSDPTWPCIQRKVERLSMGLMWPGEVPETELEGEMRRALSDLAGTLALQRVSLEDAETRVAEFTEAHGDDPELMGRVFASVFDRLNQRRTRIIEGIEEYSLGQIALSERIDEARVRMDTLMEADEPDFDQVDELEEQVDWDERIYTDRQKSLTYVCETPVLLEKRLYAIASLLQNAQAGN